MGFIPNIYKVVNQTDCFFPYNCIHKDHVVETLHKIDLLNSWNGAKDLGPGIRPNSAEREKREEWQSKASFLITNIRDEPQKSFEIGKLYPGSFLTLLFILLLSIWCLSPKLTTSPRLCSSAPLPSLSEITYFIFLKPHFNLFVQWFSGRR